MSESKSPLKAPPLRLPGQSLETQLDDYVTDHALLPIVGATFMVGMAFMEWSRYWNQSPPMPWLVTAMATAVCAYAGWKVWRAKKKVRQLKQGRDGERAVGQFLERFRVDGFQIFHDVVTGDANIDHVLIGPRGIFTIETKTLSKPVRGECRIIANHEGVTANGLKLDRNPVIQAKAQAAWLKHQFGDADFKVSVQPVVVFPGWFVEPADFNAIGAWVLEPKALPAFIERRAEVISESDVRSLSLALANYIRSQAKL